MIPAFGFERERENATKRPRRLNLGTVLGLMVGKERSGGRDHVRACGLIGRAKKKIQQRGI